MWIKVMRTPMLDGEVGKEQLADRLLTVQEVASLLRVPVSWVYECTRRRLRERLPGIRLGKYWRFQQAEIHAWLEGQREGGEPNLG
jgi:excisionase family DNA binding protein